MYAIIHHDNLQLLLSYNLLTVPPSSVHLLTEFKTARKPAWSRPQGCSSAVFWPSSSPISYSMPISRASASNTAPNSISILQTPWRRDGPDLKPRRPVGIGDKVVVMTKLQEEHTEWVKEELFESLLSLFALSSQALNNTHSSWDRALNIINLSREVTAEPGQLITPAPRGQRGNGLPHLPEEGYINLRCNWNSGCRGYYQGNRHVTEGIFTEISQQTSTLPLSASEVSQLKESIGSIYDELVIQTWSTNPTKSLRIYFEQGSTSLASFRYLFQSRSSLCSFHFTLRKRPLPPIDLLKILHPSILFPRFTNGLPRLVRHPYRPTNKDSHSSTADSCLCSRLGDNVLSRSPPLLNDPPAQGLPIYTLKSLFPRTIEPHLHHRIPLGRSKLPLTQLAKQRCLPYCPMQIDLLASAVAIPALPVSSRSAE